MYSYFQSNPPLGTIISVIFGAISLYAHSFADVDAVKFATALGAYAGAGVAVLTFVIWLIKLYHILKGGQKP